MKTTKQKTKLVMKYFSDKNGNIDLSGLDFSSYSISVNISNMKVRRNLIQSCQEVGGTLYQEEQQALNDLYQNNQTVGGYIHQDNRNTINHNKKQAKRDHIFEEYSQKLAKTTEEHAQQIEEHARQIEELKEEYGIN